MRANELMIGDWVTYSDKDLYSDSDSFLQVIEIDYSTVDVIYGQDDNRGIETLPYDEIAPIPLSEEILKLNEKGLNDAGLSFNLDSIEPDKHGYDFYDSFINEHFVATIRFVHQLQNMLRAIGCGALARELKVRS